MTDADLRQEAGIVRDEEDVPRSQVSGDNTSPEIVQEIRGRAAFEPVRLWWAASVKKVLSRAKLDAVERPVERSQEFG
jgi:hypothetical protein